MQPEIADTSLSREARRFLLDLARATIGARLGGAPLPSLEPDDDRLLDRRGAFVTLKIDGRLRGCIGHVVGVVPLWLAVRDNAIAAAFEDPRFAPLEADELPLASSSIEVPLADFSFPRLRSSMDGIGRPSSITPAARPVSSPAAGGIPKP
jgi:AMMECR1 domain-containing protein